MPDQTLLEKLPNVPLVQPGFDSLELTAPVIVQLNPDGQWSDKKPDGLEEERLKSIVQHLVNSKSLSAGYCCQCAEDNKNLSPGESDKNYVPVIMMRIYAADDCPFDMECEIQKMKEAQPSKGRKKKTLDERKGDDDKYKDKGKSKKRGFVMQRLTNFLSSAFTVVK